MMATRRGQSINSSVKRSDKATYWCDISGVEIWIAVVDHDGQWEEEIETELEEFEIRAGHVECC